MTRTTPAAGAASRATRLAASGAALAVVPAGSLLLPGSLIPAGVAGVAGIGGRGGGGGLGGLRTGVSAGFVGGGCFGAFGWGGWGWLVILLQMMVEAAGVAV